VTGAPVAEALLGTHILEDLGVPRQLLGTSTRTLSETGQWKVPASLYELRLFMRGTSAWCGRRGGDRWRSS